MLGAALVLVPGCGIPQNEEDGQKEPVLGNYAITLLPPNIPLDLDVIGPPLARYSVDLSVECLAPVPSDDCGSNQPDWQFIAPPLVTVAILNPKSPRTTADITFNRDAYVNAHPDGANSVGAPESISIRFFPTTIPKDLTLYPVGGATFVLQLQHSRVPPPQTEQTPDKPSLIATPKLPEGFFIDDSQPVATRSITVTYKGPRSKLVTASIDGDGAAAYSINPGITGIPLPGDGTGPVIIVTGDRSRGFGSAKLTLKADCFKASDEAGCTAVVYLIP